jgi:hypothetical protein
VASAAGSAVVLGDQSTRTRQQHLDVLMARQSDRILLDAVGAACAAGARAVP